MGITGMNKAMTRTTSNGTDLKLLLKSCQVHCCLHGDVSVHECHDDQQGLDGVHSIMITCGSAYTHITLYFKGMSQV